MKHYYIIKLTFFLVSFSSILLNVLESIYVFVFNKPVFVHVYIMKKKLSRRQKEFLENNITFYKKP